MEEVRHRIRALRHKNTDGKWFVPDGSLLCTLDQGTITSLLEQHCDVEPYGLEWTAQAVRDRATKVFAILILIREHRKISAFLEQYLPSDNQTLDSRLPFSVTELQCIFSVAVANEFEEQQWGFTAPVFSHRLMHRNIPLESPLPFTESRKLGSGGFGNVYEITVVGGHHNFKGSDSAEVSLPSGPLAQSER